MTVVVVDYDAGNLASICNALKHLDTRYVVSDDPAVVTDGDCLIFPGVGEARAAMQTLRNRGLDDALRRFFASGRAMLGICVGAQIVLDFSEERATDCLGLIPGRVQRFQRTNGMKIPHIGWNSVRYCDGSLLFDGIAQGASFYFLHSYCPKPTEAYAEIAWSDYGTPFVAGVQRDNLYCTQFHPEKSGRNGLRLMANFLAL